MQMILTHQGVRVQANSEQECQDAQLPDLIRVSTPEGHFEIPRKHAMAVCRLVGMAHSVTRAKPLPAISAGPDNIVPIMHRKQAD